jgi:CDP-4-dehydro-6-deoxyglucose reductase
MQARLIERIEIAPGFGSFVFEAQDGDNFNFTPGQFVSFTAEIGGKRITRAYSIASAPDSTPSARRFELYLNLAPDGIFSHLLFAMNYGDTVEMRPPLGTFVLRQPPRDSIFVATGTGIAPFRSMLRAHLDESSPQFTLLFGVRYESHLMYRAEFEDLAARFPQFRFWPTLSRPEPGWTGRTGHVQAHLEEALGERRDVDVYLCGLKLMVDDVRARLRAAGFDRKQIFYEKYD